MTCATLPVDGASVCGGCVAAGDGVGVAVGPGVSLGVSVVAGEDETAGETKTEGGVSPPSLPPQAKTSAARKKQATMNVRLDLIAEYRRRAQDERAPLDRRDFVADANDATRNDFAAQATPVHETLDHVGLPDIVFETLARLA
jgi:hypothetical protein